MKRAFRYYLVLLAITSGLMFGCGESAPTYQFWRVSTYFRLDSRLSEPFGIAVHDGRVYYSDGHVGEVVGFIPGDAGLKTRHTGLVTPSGIAINKEGVVFVADSGSNTIKQLGQKSEVSIVAGIEDKRGLSDGEARNALFNGPTGLAFADDGRLFVADTYNDRIRVVEKGSVRTLAGGARGFADGSGSAAMFDTPLGLAIWGDKLLVADAGNRRIRVVEADGTVWTLAGDGSGDGPRDGIPAFASLVGPTAVAVDEHGMIFIADGNAIRAIGLRSFPFLETIAGGRRGSADNTPRLSQFNRPSGLAFLGSTLLIADSDNGVIRSLHGVKPGTETSGITKPEPEQITAEEFRALAPARWPYDPPLANRDIAGTLGEIRGTIKDDSSRVWFHNGLDIAGNYGETARFVRDEKVLDPMSAENFGTLRELFRMPTLGYIHINLGRDVKDVTFDDDRFVFNYNKAGNAMAGVRVPRGASFKAGEAIGTLNAMNHVHLIAGRSGAEMNALAALELPGVSDSIVPVIEKVTLFDESWNEIETNAGSGRIKLTGKTRLVVRAYDRMDGNSERRRLGVYKLGYAILKQSTEMATPGNWSITFDKNPPNDAVRFVYAKDSHSGASGETIFNYIATNTLSGNRFTEGFIDPTTIGLGQHTIRVYAADFFGNTASKDIQIEVTQ